eukprot:m.88763 g.88763  ORF g.88763 m.88763 type:complete len:323 (-) comp8382_c4_seq1:78-1046(-)
MADLKAFEQRAQEAEALVASLESELKKLREGAEAEAVQRLTKENQELKSKVAEAKNKLRAVEIANGKLQVPLPGETPAATTKSAPAAKAATPAAAAAPAAAATPAAAAAKPAGKADKAAAKADKPAEAKADKGEKKAKDAKPAKDAAPKKEAAEPAAEKVDVSRVAFKVGKVVDAKKHPEAEKLYLETIDLGEAQPRTVLSGLADHIPLDQLQGRLVVLCTNLKPRKMRGIESQAMIMCANNGEKVEIIDPPAGSVPGDKIVFPDYPGEPDAELNPKKMIFEAVQPDLKTDDKCVATYKGSPFTVAGKGVCKVQTLINSSVK